MVLSCIPFGTGAAISCCGMRTSMSMLEYLVLLSLLKPRADLVWSEGRGCIKPAEQRLSGDIFI